MSGGAIIQDGNITTNGISRPWTLGNYLLLLRKNPASVKIGVAYVDDDHTDSDEGCTYSSGLLSQVLHANLVHID